MFLNTTHWPMRFTCTSRLKLTRGPPFVVAAVPGICCGCGGMFPQYIADFSYISVDSLCLCWNHFSFAWRINIKLFFRAFSVLNLKLQAPRVNSFVSVTTVSFVSDMGIFFLLFSGGDSLQSRNREKRRKTKTSLNVKSCAQCGYFMVLFIIILSPFFSYFKCFFPLGLSWVWVMIVSFVRLFTSLETRPS